MLDTIQSRGVATEETTFLRGRTPDCESAIMQAGNGTTVYLRVKGGTPIGRITANGLVRPCGKTRVNGALSAVNTFVVDDDDCFYDGDTIGVYSADGVKGSATLDGDGGGTADIDLESRTADGLAHSVQVVSPTLGVRGSVSIVASGAGDEIDLRSRTADGLAHTVELVDPGAASDLQAEATVDAATGVTTLVIRLASSAVPAITSTVQDVIDEINAGGYAVEAFLHTGDNGAATAIAVAATPLAGAVAAPADRTLRARATLSATDVETLVVTLGLNSLGTALDSTVNDVIGCINAESRAVEARLAAGGVGTNTAAAVAATPLAGAIAEGGAIATGRTLTKAGTSFTISGAAIDVADDDIVRLENGAQTAIGLLFQTVDTAAGVDYDNGTILDVQVGCMYFDRGTVDASACPGVNADIQADLPAMSWH